MFGFFRKRRDPTLEDYQREMSKINQNLRNSFVKIKQDVKTIREWIDHFHNKHTHHSKKIQHIENKLSELNETVSYSLLAASQKEEPRELIQEAQILEDPQEEITSKVLDDLTDTQKSIFHRVGTLLKESGQKWITIKSLALDLYPNKSYDQIRSTASEYISILIEASLLNKKRKGKQTYITLTKKGEKFFNKSKKAKKIIARSRK